MARTKKTTSDSYRHRHNRKDLDTDLFVVSGYALPMPDFCTLAHQLCTYSPPHDDCQCTIWHVSNIYSLCKLNNPRTGIVLPSYKRTCCTANLLYCGSSHALQPPAQTRTTMTCIPTRATNVFCSASQAGNQYRGRSLMPRIANGVICMKRLRQTSHIFVHFSGIMQKRWMSTNWTQHGRRVQHFTSSQFALKESIPSSTSACWV